MASLLTRALSIGVLLLAQAVTASTDASSKLTTCTLHPGIHAQLLRDVTVFNGGIHELYPYDETQNKEMCKPTCRSALAVAGGGQGWRGGGAQPGKAAGLWGFFNPVLAFLRRTS